MLCMIVCRRNEQRIWSHHPVKVGKSEQLIISCDASDIHRDIDKPSVHAWSDNEFDNQFNRVAYLIITQKSGLRIQA